MLINAVVPLCLIKIHENWNKFCNNPIVIIVHINILSTQLQLQPVGQAKNLAPIRLLTSLVKYSGSKAKLERFLLCQITPLWQIQHSDRSDNRHPTGRTEAVASVWSAASLVVSCFPRLQLTRPPATGAPPLPLWLNRNSISLIASTRFLRLFIKMGKYLIPGTVLLC